MEKEISTVSWIITLLSISEYCWTFFPKHLRVDIYNFCSPVCYHCNCQSHKMRTVSPAMSYLWPTCAAVFDFVLFRIPVIYKADSPQLSQSGHFLDLGRTPWEQLIHRGYLSSSPKLNFLYLQSIAGKNRMHYLIFWNRRSNTFCLEVFHTVPSISGCIWKKKRFSWLLALLSSSSFLEFCSLNLSIHFCS